MALHQVLDPQAVGHGPHSLLQNEHPTAPGESLVLVERREDDLQPLTKTGVLTKVGEAGFGLCAGEHLLGVSGQGKSAGPSRHAPCAALRFNFLERQQSLGRIDRLFAGGCKPAPLPGMRGPP
jgi:hypothetical protein